MHMPEASSNTQLDHSALIGTLKTLGNNQIATHSKRFFKTGKGEYAEGDQFIGVRVPVIRKTIKPFKKLPLDEVSLLLGSKIHEIRLAGLVILVEQYKTATPQLKSEIYQLYMQHTTQINNWDLVDISAPNIVGHHLKTRNRKKLYQLVKSPVLWERRIAIIATLYFIRNGEYNDTIELAVRLLNDKEDLIHKATGWMLREVGKKEVSTLTQFLDQHAHQMPRIMLRYSIEKLPENTRKAYLRK